MCDECKKVEVYKLNLCEGCYGKMFEKLVYSVHEVKIVNKLNLSDAGYALEYAFGEGSAFVRHNYYVSVAERFKLMDEFYQTGKITVTNNQLFTNKAEIEVLEPDAIRFSPVESVYVKTPANIQIPSVVKPRKIWHRSNFDSWNREATETRFNQELSQEEQYKAQIEIAQRYGMELKEN